MTTARYDEIAEWYDGLVQGWSDGLEPVASAVLELAGDLPSRISRSRLSGFFMPSPILGRMTAEPRLGPFGLVSALILA